VTAPTEGRFARPQRRWGSAWGAWGAAVFDDNLFRFIAYGSPGFDIRYQYQHLSAQASAMLDHQHN